MEPLGLHKFLMRDFPELKSIIGNGVLHERGKLMLFGKEKTFKSMLMLSLALAVASGESWVGFGTTPTSVLYLQIEVPPRLLQERLQKMYKHWHQKPHINADAPLCAECGQHHYEVNFWSDLNVKLDTPTGLATLSKHLSILKPKLLIVDPMYKIRAGDLLDPNAFRDFSDVLDQIADRFNLAIIMATHSSKREVEADAWGSDPLMGPALIAGWADTVIWVTRRRKENVVKLNFDVSRDATELIKEVRATLDSDTLEFLPIQDVLPKDTLKDIKPKE